MSEVEVLFHRLGERLVEQARGATEEVLLVAPFIKRDPLDRILSPLPDGCFVRVVTRWEIREIAAGVSDLEIWRLLRKQGNSTLELLPSLHAKYYRFDEVCLSGSANLTGAALGWGESPNLEFLARFPADRAAAFEDELGDSQVVTEDMHQRYQKRVQEYGETEPSEVLIHGTDPVAAEGAARAQEERREQNTGPETKWWIPELKEPQYLYQIYTGDSESVPQESWNRGTRDLRHLELPDAGATDKGDFRRAIGEQLLEEPVVEEIDDIVASTKSFRFIREHLRSLPCAENEGFEAVEAWETLRAWLLRFLDGRYRQHESHFTRSR